VPGIGYALDGELRVVARRDTTALAADAAAKRTERVVVRRNVSPFVVDRATVNETLSRWNSRARSGVF